MKILALDQSTTGTGFAFFADDSLAGYGLIKPKVSKKINEIIREFEDHLYSIKMPEEMYGTTLLRSTAIAEQIEELIDTFKPDAVYFEEIFDNGNPSGFRSLARLQGFICWICHKHNIPYHIIEETKWINSMGTYSREIKRPERKADIMQKMNDLYGLYITTDDISDAIAIGRYAIQNEKEK